MIQITSSEKQNDGTKHVYSQKKISKWFWIICTIPFLILFILIMTSGEDKRITTSVKQERTSIVEIQNAQPTEAEQVQLTEEVKEELQQNIVISDEEAIEIIEETIKSFGLSASTIQIANGRKNGGRKILILGYKSIAITQDKLLKETAEIAGAYIGVKKNGWDIDELSVIIGNMQGNAVGMWYCSKEWTDSFIKGEITKEDLLFKITSSIESFI